MKSDYDFSRSRRNPYSSRFLNWLGRCAGSLYKARLKSERTTREADALCPEPTSALMIKSEADYQRALARLDELLQAEFGSEEGEELDELATLIEAYEKSLFR